VRPQSNAWTCLVSLYQVLAFSVPCGVRAGPYCPTRPRKHLLTANSIIRPAGKPFSPFFIEISAYTPPTKKPRAHLSSGQSDIKNKIGAYVLAGLTKSRVFDTGCRMTHEISKRFLFSSSCHQPGLSFLHSDEPSPPQASLDKDKKEKEVVLVVVVVVEMGQCPKRKAKSVAKGGGGGWGGRTESRWQDPPSRRPSKRTRTNAP